MQKHRLPPKPVHYLNSAPGHCRYCGDPLLDRHGRLRVRAAWHAGCLEAYKVIYWPGHTRKAVWKRDHGHCVDCHTVAPTGAWHVDHIRPLYEAKGDLDYWRLDNLATRCIPCHNAKSAREAGERAAARRQQLIDLSNKSD